MNALAERRGAPHPTALLAATILGSSMAFVDSSAVNVALPVIRHDLRASVAQMQWLVNGYLLPLSALVLLGGAAGDRFGRRRIFTGGIILFAVGSVCCALAPTFAFLLAARALQGVGAALLLPTSLALLSAGLDGEARGRAIGTWAAAGAITAAIGPVVGGWLVDAVGWRAIFVINLPLAAGALWLAYRYVRETSDGASPTLDWAGPLLAAVGLGALVWALTELPTRQVDRTVLGVTTIAGAVALVAFLAVEHRLGERAMMPLALFGSRTFVGVTVFTLCLYAGLGGLVVLLPYLLITAGRYPATAAGAALLPMPILMGAASRSVGRWAARIGPRLPLTVGSLLVALGFSLGLRLDAAHLDYWRYVFPVAVTVAAGMALSVAPLTSTVMAAVDRRHAGSASGVNDAVAYVASLIAVALLGLVITPGGTGPATSGVHGAALAGVALALAAAVSALLLV
jgi:EmrB/QacA subfamily drug resistance transporter